MLRNHLAYLIVSLAALTSAGCCCTPQGIPVGTMAGGCGATPTVIGGGGLFGLAGCRAGCGEVYIDEWISEPPTADNCGYECGGCGRCNQCQPIRNALRLLWGRPYVSNCCSESCDGGCDSCDGAAGEMHWDGGVAHSAGGGCTCGQQHGDATLLHSAPSFQNEPSGSSATPMEIVPTPQQVPTPAPTVAPTTSTKRLNPAQQRLNVRTASSSVNRR